MAVHLGMDLSEAQKHRMEQLNELDEIRQEAILRTDLVQYQRAKWYDKYIKEKKFKKESGHCYLIPSSKTSKVNFRLIGLGHMRLTKSLAMER